MENAKHVLGCIADDFTGASDAASFLQKAGLTVVLLNGVPRTDLVPEGYDALVVALKTRTEPVQEAVAHSMETVKWLEKQGATQYYFKYCSTFDSTREGNIGPILDAALEYFDEPYTILCPALPVNGRKVVDGHLYVNGVPLHESPMKDHPLTPMWDSRIKNLMEAQSQYPCFEIGSDALAGEAVTKQLEEISRGEINTLSKKLGVAPVRIRRAMESISRLNPRPLNGLDTSTTHYVIPDLLLEWDAAAGRLEASLNDDWSADYRLSDYYLRMLQSVQDPQLQAYFKQKYQRAKLLIEGIEQRRRTLLAIGNYLGRVQERFLLGKGKKVSLTMTEAAAELELSVSTISRAVKGKYVQHPAGCTPLKALFITPVTGAAPAQLSRDAIKDAIKALVQNEDKHAPHSDAELTEKLAEMEIFISRRTVAKYRESLGIPGCFDRRRYEDEA